MGRRDGRDHSNRIRVVAAIAAALIVSSCGVVDESLSQHDDRLQVITTTPILRDLVENVGGDAAQVSSLVPDGADPHTYEPTLRDVRNVVYADVAFSNYLLLEEQAIVRALDANLPDEAPNISVAEEAVKYAAEVIPLVENVALDTIWLGLRSRGDGAIHGANRSSDVQLSMTDVTGPADGDVYGYLTGTFGDTDVMFDSSDGFDAADGYRDDSTRLPVDAHTHLSWVFTEPGTYELTFEAHLQVDSTSRPLHVAIDTFTVAVGVDPTVAAQDGQQILDRGHADLTVDIETGELYALYDPEGGGEHSQETVAASDAVIAVPSMALSEVPGDPQFSFLGRAGEPIYQLPQAVLGRHVHGEIDPHLWQDVGNAMAYVELIRDVLIGADAENARVYAANASAYLDELEQVDREIADTIASIPEHRRHLVTTHDAFGYLAAAYDIQIGGFVTPNPATEPSLAERRRLSQIVQNLEVPAVFVEPSLISRSATLTDVADQHDLEVCAIYGDTFDDEVTTYTEMMRFNAASLADCLNE